ncbi:porin [Paraburkholderia sp. Tr-20389]|uniref:porin n=1 Tax=Paraburkholderia sp. Tr-20389 TaxID=2703903 RepID=UPI00197DAE89|nr:porin [Paraburkholderia sp. Tr-20389]MBN3754769.1 porin [Paraburkholderia sp. Tr-20389]
MTADKAAGIAVGIALCVATSTARAQNSLNMYGVIDAGLLYNSNIKGRSSYGVSTATPSRWGLRGSEYLGDGLDAIFNLENGFTVGTGASGQGGLLFGRKAFIGLSSASWGTLALGRQYSVSNDTTSVFASGADWAACGLGYGTRAADVDNVDTSNRIQNSVKYTSPNVGGFTLGVLYGLGNVAGRFAQNSVKDIGLGYANGPLKLGASYMFTKDPYYATFGDQGNSSTTAAGSSNNMPSRIFGGYASAGSQQIVTAGGSYVAGQFTVSALYSNTQFRDLGAVNAGGSYGIKYNGGSATFNSGELNVKYAASPALTLAAAYIYTRNSGAGDYGSAHYNQVNIGATYSVTRRTSLYADGFFETASGTDSTGKAAVANFYGSTYSSTGRAVAAIVGMTHRF